MAVAFTDRERPLEQRPRRALLWGGGLLALGLAAVGVGQPDEGAVLALAGLLVTIYGIHCFGRLGPDDPRELAAPDSDRRGRAAPLDTMWTGALALVAGLVVVVGSYFEPRSVGGGGGIGRFLVAYGAVLGGAARMALGYLELRKVQRRQAKVEKKRRLDKSRAP